MIVIITEKPSARRNFEKALGGKQGSFNGEEYKLVNSVGHIMQFPKDITKLISDKDKHDKYKTWDIRNLPFSYEDFRFIKEISKSSDGKSLKSVYEDIKINCLKASEIVIASDDDPSGEGTLLVAEILLTFYNDIKNKKISRMFFADESESEIQKAFINRVNIPDLLQDKDFIKSDYRSKWDYLSIQFTRIATTLIGGAVLRNGRLKSFMNTLVGDQIKRVNDYKKIPMYQQAFISDTGVWFLKKNNDVYKDSLEVPKIDGNDFNIIIKEKKEKYTAPGKLLDLAGLSAILESKGYKAKEILETYQHMYEDQIVSYPRTEDKVVTIEQYKEMLNIAPKIADVIGIDKSLLTHIEPRKQHLGNGSHGANRPGSNVPDNLDSLDSKYGKGAKDIYLILSKNYLSILGEDLKYEQTTAYIDGYEDFVGTSKKVLDLGFKKIFKLDDDEEIEDKVIGSIANYKVKESFPKKPATPTMKWLMKELEKFNVGTGATRTSTYAELVDTKQKNPLMKADKGKLSLTDLGIINYILLQGTFIGSSALTEKLQSEMKEIDANSNIPHMLSKMQEYVRHDLDVMKSNLNNVPKDLVPKKEEYKEKEKYYGIWNGHDVCFNRIYCGYRFTDNECELLCLGNTLKICLNGKYGEYYVSGKLAQQTYKGNKFVGFKKLSKRCY